MCSDTLSSRTQQQNKQDKPMNHLISNQQWQQFERDSFLRLGRVLSDDDLAALRERIDDIMLGRADVAFDRMLMQLDASDVNHSDIARRAFSVCYMNGNTHTANGEEYSIIFEEGALDAEKLSQAT